MLRLSKLTDYGTVVMTYMAHAPERVHTAREITTSVDIALPTVSKILKLLTKEGLLISYRGAKGGYRLARAPRCISVAEIIGALEGRVGLTECSTSPGLCSHEPVCAVRTNWQRINTTIMQALESVSLAEMTKPVSKLRPVDMPRRSAPAGIGGL